MGQQQARDQLPVDVGEIHSCTIGRTIWSVHSGKRKDSGNSVTVFVFNFENKSDDEIRLARSAHLRLKTLRHPNILKYIDGIELQDCIYMMTEEATPLQIHLQSQEGQSSHLISWGIHQITKSLSFLNIDCGLVHHNICISSIFVDNAGEWKLGGVEYMHPFSDTNIPIKSLDSLRRYDPPETNKPGISKRNEKWSTDMWGLGCLIWEVFNGPLPQSTALKTTTKIPKSLLSHYCELVSGNPRSRPSPATILLSLREQGGYLDNQFVSLNLRLEEIQIMEQSQRNRFFTELNKSLDLFPNNFGHHKVLPHLLNAFEFGGAGSSVLAPLLKISRHLDLSEYQKKIVPCIVKLFNSNDRATRLNLLQQLDQFIDHLDSSVINDQIFLPLTTGFSDTEPVVREYTVKSMLLIAPKLNDSNLNTQLLKHFAKCQLDEKPGIRTNTTVCLGKIASYLNTKTRQKILISAFTRSLKDPFPPARIAGITSLAITHTYYTSYDIAQRVLPILCTVTVDNDKAVRDQSFKVIKIFLEKLEKHSETMTSQLQDTESINQESGNSWTGWAVSSISKLYGSTNKPGNEASVSKSKDKKPVQPAIKTDSTPDNTTISHDTRGNSSSHDTRDNSSSPDGWDDKWDDFEPTSDTKPNPHIDDDSWDDFDQTSSNIPSTTNQKTSSLMKLESKRLSPVLQEEDFWTRMGATQQSSTFKEKTPPPPVPASIFEVQGGGWDDIDFGSNITETSSKQQEKSKCISNDNDGWGFDDGGWQSMDTPLNEQKEELNRQELNQKRREERRLKQQAAREKRSSGMVLKPSGLGAIKKD